jgi:hypothetical protein
LRSRERSAWPPRLMGRWVVEPNRRIGGSHAESYYPYFCGRNHQSHGRHTQPSSKCPNLRPSPIFEFMSSQGRLYCHVDRRLRQSAPNPRDIGRTSAVAAEFPHFDATLIGSRALVSTDARILWIPAGAFCRFSHPLFRNVKVSAIFVRCMSPQVARRVISWRRSNSVAFGAKRTFSEPR